VWETEAFCARILKIYLINHKSISHQMCSHYAAHVEQQLANSEISHSVAMTTVIKIAKYLMKLLLRHIYLKENNSKHLTTTSNFQNYST
jgi:hypothetical protein